MEISIIKILILAFLSRLHILLTVIGAVVWVACGFKIQTERFINIKIKEADSDEDSETELQAELQMRALNSDPAHAYKVKYQRYQDQDQKAHYQHHEKVQITRVTRTRGPWSAAKWAHWQPVRRRLDPGWPATQRQQAASKASRATYSETSAVHSKTTSLFHNESNWNFCPIRQSHAPSRSVHDVKQTWYKEEAYSGSFSTGCPKVLNVW